MTLFGCYQAKSINLTELFIIPENIQVCIQFSNNVMPHFPPEKEALQCRVKSPNMGYHCIFPVGFCYLLIAVAL
jgi:hypothetical protein